MEIYRNEVEELRHYVVSAGLVTTADGIVMLRIYDADGVQVFSDEPILVDPVDGTPYYSQTVGTNVTNLGAGHTIEWSYTVSSQPVVKTEQLNIVTPYLPLGTLLTMPELEGLETFALRKMERLVAGIIDVFTNQTFSRENDRSLTVIGQDSDNLALPKPIIELKDIELLDGGTGIEPYSLLEYTTFDKDSPWILRRRRDVFVPRKLTPTARYAFFKYPMMYLVTGDWGWEYVPADVSRAAEILVKDYFCEDAKYREKYIANIRAGDWRMEFKVTGDETTGSANADMLLTGYRNVAAVVI